MYFDVQHLLTEFQKERYWISPDLQAVFLLYELLAGLLACKSWGTGDFCSCKTEAPPKPGTPASCECARDCNLHELQGSRSRSVCATRVCRCFLVCHFNLHSLPKEPRLSNEWAAAPRNWEGLLTISDWSSLPPSVGPITRPVKKQQLHVNHFLHPSKGKPRIIWLQMHRNSQMSESSQSSVLPSVLLILSCSISDIQFPIT